MNITLTETNLEQIPLDELVCDERFQIRSATNEDAIADYARMYHDAPGKMPALKVWRDAQGVPHVVCGHHRYKAAITVKDLGSLECEIIEGDERTARLVALRDNKSNGVRMSNADKRHAVEMMLNDPEWAEWADRKIASVVGVSPTTVGAVRKELSVQLGQIAVSETTETEPRTVKVERNGTVYEQKVRTPEPDDDFDDPFASDEEADHDPADALDTAIARADELQAISQQLVSNVDSVVRALCLECEGDPHLEGRVKAIRAAAKQLRHECRFSEEAHVCPHCMGEGCDACGGTGVQPALHESMYEAHTVQAMCHAVAERLGCRPQDVTGWKD